MTDLPPPPEDRERRDVALFVARNRAKFMPVYDARTAGRRSVPFCWPGFLFPQAWFLYRKMYIYAAVAVAGPLLASQLLHSVALVSLPISALGLFGRALYVREARDAITRIRASVGDEAEAESLIARAGGVSPLGAGLGVLFVLASMAILSRGGPLIPPASHP